MFANPDTFMKNSYNLTIIVIFKECKRKNALGALFQGRGRGARKGGKTGHAEFSSLDVRRRAVGGSLGSADRQKSSTRVLKKMTHPVAGHELLEYGIPHT